MESTKRTAFAASHSSFGLSLALDWYLEIICFSRLVAVLAELISDSACFEFERWDLSFES